MKISFSRRKIIGSLLGVSFGKTFLSSSHVQAGQAINCKTLKIIAWERFLDPYLLTIFERLHHCKVDLTTFKTNEELFTRLNAGLVAYDICTPSSYITPLLKSENLIKPLNLSSLKLRESDAVIGDKVLGKAVDSHSISVSWSVTGIAYHAGNNPKPMKTWDSFGHVLNHRRCALLDDMRELLGASLISIGKSANSNDPNDLIKAVDIASGWVENARLLGNGGQTFPLIAGEDLIAQSYNGDVWIASEVDPALRFFVPDEGGLLSVDQLCLCSNASEVELAHLFMDFISEPEHAKSNMLWSGYASLNPLVELIWQSDRNRPDSSQKELIMRSEVLSTIDLELWESAWQKLISKVCHE